MTDLSLFLVMIGMGSIFAWTACLLVGCRLLAPDHAIAIGVAGLWIGWEVFRKLGIPLGPSYQGIEFLPGFVGTLLLLVAYLVIRELYDRKHDGTTPPPPRTLDREVPRFVRERND